MARVHLAGRPMRSVYAYVGLGSNLGGRLASLRRAAEALDTGPSLRVRRRSSIYESAAIGPRGVVDPDEPPFLNAVLEVETQLAPRSLLHRCLEIEQRLGRVRTETLSRTIDVDILLYGDEVIAEHSLVIPHGDLHLRAFALVPLVEIEPTVEHPALGRRAATLLKLLPAQHVSRIEETW